MEHFTQMSVFARIWTVFAHLIIGCAIRYPKIGNLRVLDLILTNEEEMVDNVTYLHGLGKSDHICIVFGMVYFTEKQYKSFKFFTFKKLIGSSFGMLGCQPSLEKITDIFTNFVHSTIPLQTIHPTKGNPYINSKVLKFKKKKLYYEGNIVILPANLTIPNLLIHVMLYAA